MRVRTTSQSYGARTQRVQHHWGVEVDTNDTGDYNAHNNLLLLLRGDRGIRHLPNAIAP